MTAAAAAAAAGAVSRGATELLQLLHLLADFQAGRAPLPASAAAPSPPQLSPHAASPTTAQQAARPPMEGVVALLTALAGAAAAQQ